MWHMTDSGRKDVLAGVGGGLLLLAVAKRTDEVETKATCSVVDVILIKIQQWTVQQSRY